MKNIMTLALACTCIGAAVPCLAQSSVTLYGIVDEGLTYTINQNGGHNFQLQSGVTQGSRWGLRAAEDLGGGMRVAFVLENGFDSSTGVLGQNNRLFGRSAYVGIDSHAGTLTLGRQYELMADFVAPVSGQGQWANYFAHAGDVDNLNGTFRADNAIKYVSPTFAGLRLGALYSFGGQAGAFATNSVLSLGVSYSNGPFLVAGAYTRINRPYAAVYDSVPRNILFISYLSRASSEAIYGLGASYTAGAFKGGVDVTRTVFRADLNGANVEFDNYEAWLSYRITPTLHAGAGYTLTGARMHIPGEQLRYQQVNLIADYFLSKRTDIYAMAACMNGSGGSRTQINAIMAASSSNRQSLLRIGMRHKF